MTRHDLRVLGRPPLGLRRLPHPPVDGRPSSTRPIGQSIRALIIWEDGVRGAGHWPRHRLDARAVRVRTASVRDLGGQGPSRVLERHTFLTKRTRPARRRRRRNPHRTARRPNVEPGSRSPLAARESPNTPGPCGADGCAPRAHPPTLHRHRQHPPQSRRRRMRRRSAEDGVLLSVLGSSVTSTVESRARPCRSAIIRR